MSAKSFSSKSCAVGDKNWGLLRHEISQEEEGKNSQHSVPGFAWTLKPGDLQWLICVTHPQETFSFSYSPMLNSPGGFFFFSF